MLLLLIVVVVLRIVVRKPLVQKPRVVLVRSRECDGFELRGVSWR